MVRANSSVRRIHRVVITGVMLSAAAGTLVLDGPTTARSTSAPSTASAVAAVLPATGVIPSQRGLMQREAAAKPAIVYVEYVPPPPPPAPAYAGPMPWWASSGVVTIPVPIYRQAMVLDCETGALRMGLAAFGHYYTDAALFAYENPDTTPPVMDQYHNVVHWGDPYQRFVGNVNGSDWTPTGYGVYYPVIVSIARSHGLPNTQGGEGYAPATIYAALLAHHPVEVWIETNWSRPRMGVWTAWDGQRVRYSYAEHAVTLSGVSGSMVRVNDPLHGSQYWVSKGLFEAVWRDFNDMAVIFQ